MPPRHRIHRPPPPPCLFSVERPPRSSLRCVRVHEKQLGVPWHFHPEYQLTLVLAGVGQRVVGDSIEPVGSGDLTLLGPNLPHFWDVDPPRGQSRRRTGSAGGHAVDAIVIQFDPAMLGEPFWSLPETQPVVGVLRRSERGLVFSPSIRSRVESALLRLPDQSPLEQLLHLIELLHRLATDRAARQICSPAYTPLQENCDRDRLAEVIRRIQEHVLEAANPPGRAELANLAGVSERTFSRYFCRRMNRTLPQFINELRVGRARRLLLETPLPVTTVAHACGFRNLSNFNAQFRRITGRTPVQFRRDHHAAVSG